MERLGQAFAKTCPDLIDVFFSPRFRLFFPGAVEIFFGHFDFAAVLSVFLFLVRQLHRLTAAD
jgi:hypothetical protein